MSICHCHRVPAPHLWPDGAGLPAVVTGDRSAPNKAARPPGDMGIPVKSAAMDVSPLQREKGLAWLWCENAQSQVFRVLSAEPTSSTGKTLSFGTVLL